MVEDEKIGRRPGGQSLLSLAPATREADASAEPVDPSPDTRLEAERAELRTRAAAIKESLEQARAEAAELAARAERAAVERQRPPASGHEPKPEMFPEHRPPEEPSDRVDAVAAMSPPPPEPVGEPVAVVPVEPASRHGDSQFWKPLVDPITVISSVWNSKRIILATTILGAMLGVGIALSTPKKYQAHTELVLDPRNLNIVDRDLTQAGLPSDATLALVENQVRIMTSGNVIARVVDRLGLIDDPEFNGEARGGLLGKLADWRSLFRATDGPADDAARRTITSGNLYDSLSVERGMKTFIITVSATTEEPEKSALIANTLVEEFLETSGEIQANTATRATKELTSRLDELRRDVEAKEREVETFKAENDIINPQGRLITDEEIIKLNDQLSVARARTIELNARAQSARSIGVSDALSGSLPEQISSSVMTELRSQYASLRQEADRLSVRLGPRHPQRVAIEAQMDGARAQLQAELRRIVSSVQVELTRAVQLEQDLASRLAQLKARNANVSSELVSLRELEREAQAARAVYESYLLRARETGEQQTLNTVNMSIISAAYPPLRPTGPSRSTTAILGLLLGFAAGIAIGALRGIVQSLREGGAGSPPGAGPSPNRRRRREDSTRTEMSARDATLAPAAAGTTASGARFAPPGDRSSTSPEAGLALVSLPEHNRAHLDAIRDHAGSGTTFHTDRAYAPAASDYGDVPNGNGPSAIELANLRAGVAALRAALRDLEHERSYRGVA